MAGNIQRCAGGIKRCTGGIQRCGGGCRCLDSAANVLASFSGITADCCVLCNLPVVGDVYERIYGMTDASVCLTRSAGLCVFDAGLWASPWQAYADATDCPADPAGRSDNTAIQLAFLADLNQWRLTGFSEASPIGDELLWFYALFDWDCSSDITVSNQITACGCGFAVAGILGTSTAVAYGGSVTISVNACPSPPVVRAVTAVQQAGDSALLWTFDGDITVTDSDLTGLEESSIAASGTLISYPASNSVLVAYPSAVEAGHTWTVTAQPPGISEAITLGTTGRVAAFVGVSVVAVSFVDSNTLSWQFNGPVSVTFGASQAARGLDTTSPAHGVDILAQTAADTVTASYGETVSSDDTWIVEDQPYAIAETVYIATGTVA